MLEIKASVKVGDVISCKLISGEEWIAKLHEIKDDVYVLTKPMGIQLTQQGLAFVPAVMTGGEIKSVDMLRSNVMVMVQSEDAAKAQYIKATTGLDIPATSGLVV